MNRLALALCLLASPAVAQPHPTHDMPRDEFSLDWITEDHAVGLHLQMSSGPERLTVYPPEGWLAVPETIEVVDGQIGTVDVFRWLGM